MPWVFSFFLGTLVYFPYDDQGNRFVRIAGPVPGLFNNTSWASDNDIPKFCKAALVAAEDTGFYEHNGIEMEKFIENAKRYREGKRVKAGGSTLTQQLVKNAFLSRERSSIRKAREAVGAVLLNTISSKNFQLTWYFNVVEFGPNVYGIQNAAHHYFKTTPEKLTPNQCIALVTILPSPKKWNSSLNKKRMTSFFKKRYRVIAQRIKIMSPETITKKELRVASTKGPFGRSLYVPPVKKNTKPTEIPISLPEFDNVVVEPVNNTVVEENESIEANASAIQEEQYEESNVEEAGNSAEETSFNESADETSEIETEELSNTQESLSTETEQESLPEFNSSPEVDEKTSEENQESAE